MRCLAPPGSTFTYDHENRLTQSVVGGVTSTYAYNGDGLRVSRTSGGTTTNYVWDPSAGSGQAVAAGLPVVFQDGTNTYVYGLDLLSATDNSGVQSYFLYDGLGSTVGLTNSSGNQSAKYTYDAYGSPRNRATWSGGNYWQFTGEQRDADSGLYYFRSRYYDPAVGRFLGQDPLAGFSMSPQSLNRYGYALNNPLRWVDPWGLRNVEGTPTPTPAGMVRQCLVPTPNGCQESRWVELPTISGEPWSLFPWIKERVWDPVLNAATSECGQGLAKTVIGTLAAAGAVTGGGALIEAGGVSVVSVGSAGTSAAAVGAAAGPQNIERALTFLPGGLVQVYENCGF